MSGSNSDYQVPQCSTCASRGASIFSVVVGPELEAISDQKVCRHFAKGDVIYYAGDRPSGVFCLHQGIVKIYKVGDGGREQILRMAKSGDVFGYRSMISGEPYDDYACAVADTHLCFVPKNLFNGLLLTNPELALKILELLSNQLKTAEHSILGLAQKSIRERVAEALLLLTDTFGTESDGQTVALKFSREELANIIGSVTESTVRALSDLKTEGLIELKRQRVAILDRKRLLEIANIEN